MTYTFRSGSATALCIPLALCLCLLTATVTNGGPVVVNAASKQDQMAGAVLFHEKGCEYCHGPDGRGTEKAPDLSTVGKRLKREQIEHQIHDGGIQMPSFGDALQPDEIRQLVDYLQTRRKAPREHRSDGPAVSAGTATKHTADR